MPARVKKCCVIGCENRDARKYAITTNEKIRKVWLERIGNRKLLELEKYKIKHFQICQCHFHRDCLESNGKLKKGSLPSIDLPGYTADHEDIFFREPTKQYFTFLKDVHEIRPSTSFGWSPKRGVIAPDRTYGNAKKKKLVTENSIQDISVGSVSEMISREEECVNSAGNVSRRERSEDAEYAEQNYHSHINEQSTCEDLSQNDDKLFIGEAKDLLNFHGQVGTLGGVGTNPGFSIKKEEDAECAEQDNQSYINEQSPCEDLYQDDDKIFIAETVIMRKSKNLLNCHEQAGTFVGEEKNCEFSIKKEDTECDQQNNNLHSEQSTSEDLYPDDNKQFIQETVIMEDSKNFMNSNEREVRIAQIIDYAKELDVEELNDVVLYLKKLIKEKN